MRPPYYTSIARIGIRPDQPRAVVGPRKRGSRRPHTDAAVAAVRDLVEGSVLTYAEIAAKTGIAPASICRWTRDGGWKRPLFAPRATDTVPRERAGARLKARTLAARLLAVAERTIRELEETPGADLDKLGEALELLKLAKLAARPKRRRTAAERAAHVPEKWEPVFREGHAQTNETWETGPRALLRSMRDGGVNPERAPEDALTDFIESRAPPPPKRPPRRRSHGGRSGRNAHHAWMLERE